MTMGDETLFADLALPVVVSPILEKVINCGLLSDVSSSSSDCNLVADIAYMFWLIIVYLGHCQ